MQVTESNIRSEINQNICSIFLNYYNKVPQGTVNFPYYYGKFFYSNSKITTEVRLDKYSIFNNLFYRVVNDLYLMIIKAEEGFSKIPVVSKKMLLFSEK